jgi:orotidine-5'-phosphate decarboxylase
LINKIILALDLDTKEEIFSVLNKLGNNIKTLKIGKKIFTKYGPDLIKQLKDKNYNIFLDLKYHDIPNTVKQATYEAAKLGVSMLTIHCSGGKTMCNQAVKGATLGAEESKNNVPIILGVTALTSLDQESLSEIGVTLNIDEYVKKLAKLALNNGVHGIVCSAFEVKKLKKELDKVFIAVTPGIRFENSSKDDQKRIASPDFALKEGADYLVIGRPIYAASNPKEAINDILKAMEY